MNDKELGDLINSEFEKKEFNKLVEQSKLLDEITSQLIDPKLMVLSKRGWGFPHE